MLSATAPLCPVFGFFVFHRRFIQQVFGNLRRFVLMIALRYFASGSSVRRRWTLDKFRVFRSLSVRIHSLRFAKNSLFLQRSSLCSWPASQHVHLFHERTAGFSPHQSASKQSPLFESVCKLGCSTQLYLLCRVGFSRPALSAVFVQARILWTVFLRREQLVTMFLELCWNFKVSPNWAVCANNHRDLPIRVARVNV